jgi:hypothetical protein
MGALKTVPPAGDSVASTLYFIVGAAPPWLPRLNGFQLSDRQLTLIGELIILAGWSG